MEYFAIFAPSVEDIDSETFVFEKKDDCMKTLKAYKDARFKSFKHRSEALNFAKNGTDPPQIKIELIPKSPPPNQPPIRNLEKSQFPSLKPQELMKFRKEIEANNVPKVYEMICTNPRYLVSAGDTPSILKEGPRYNALHVAAINKHAKMAKLLLQTVEKTEFIELLHGFKDDPNVEEMSQFLLESYLNTPDKSRNETPLHFASKFGAADVVEVLISYPLCKMKPNVEGKEPKDIICERDPNAKPEVKEAIKELLKERFFVPVLRSVDSSIQPIIGDPFTPNNMPKYNYDPKSPSMEIKAYAGPMTSEQAQTFRRRWKTPPRLTPTMPVANLNLSTSPKNSLISSPINSPRMTSKSLIDLMSSTPKHKKKLFQGTPDDDDDENELQLDNNNSDKNGNHKIVTTNGILREKEEEEYKELFNDLLETKYQMDKEKRAADVFQCYRNPEPFMATPIRPRNDNNSNHINDKLNYHSNNNDSMICNVRSTSSMALMSFLDESGSIYNSDNICDSPSFKEKHIRLTDIDKGLEKVGRDLADEQNVGWKEYWKFLGRFLDIRSDEGLSCFENYLKQKALMNGLMKKLNESPEELSPSKRKNDSLNLKAICASIYSMDINDEISDCTTKITNPPPSPSSSISRVNLFNEFRQPSNQHQHENFPIKNPYMCIEQSCRTFSNRLAKLLESESIQDQHSYEKILVQEIAKLNNTIDSYKRDMRFPRDFEFKKVHARYSLILVWYLKKNNILVKCIRSFKPLIEKVYFLAEFAAAETNSFDTSKDIIKVHAACVSNFIIKYIKKQAQIFNPEVVDTETACVDAWNGPDIVKCSCSFDGNLTSSKHRREMRKKLYNESNRVVTEDLWAYRKRAQSSDDEDVYLSCSDSEDSDAFYTPPESPIPSDNEDCSDDEMNVFEESVEQIEDNNNCFTFFIEGDQPTKADSDVYNAFGDKLIIDESKYPLIYKWYNVMKGLNNKIRINNPRHFRLFTPKLKPKVGLRHS